MKRKVNKTEEAKINDVTRILLDQVEPGEPPPLTEPHDGFVTGGSVDLGAVPNRSNRTKYNRTYFKVCRVSGCGEEIDTDKTVCKGCREYAEKKLDAMGVPRPVQHGGPEREMHHYNGRVFEVLGIKHYEEVTMPRTGRSTKLRYGHKDPLHGSRHGGGNV